jgi:CubicO group peptidase (beta-lactamase class C family)
MNRRLLTHSSGLGYDALNPKYFTWRKSRGEVPGTRDMPMLERFGVPLLFEPGTSWEYGCGLDWTGILVSRLNNLSLEAYMQKHIWDPLGIQNITFHPDKKPDVLNNLVKMTVRGGIKNPMISIPIDNGEKVEWTDTLLYDIPTVDECGGQGSYGSPVSYMKILQSILSDDGKLLKSKTIDEMFTPQLGAGARKGFENFLELPYYKDAFASHKVGTKVNWGLGGMMVMQDEHTGRKRGTMSWSGLPNLLWSIDRAAGLNLMYASNVLPFGDFPSARMQVLFETEMYRRFAKAPPLSIL